MDPLTTTKPVIENRSGREFAKLAPSDFIRLGNALAEGRKAKLRQNLKDAAVAPEKALQLLNEFDARPIRHGDVLQYILTMEGQVDAIRLSLAKAKPDATAADVDGLGVAPDDLLDLAASIADLQLTPVEEKKGEPNRPLPAGGAAPPSTATGDSTPTASATGSPSPTP